PVVRALDRPAGRLSRAAGAAGGLVRASGYLSTARRLRWVHVHPSLDSPVRTGQRAGVARVEPAQLAAPSARLAFVARGARDPGDRGPGGPRLGQCGDGTALERRADAVDVALLDPGA